MLHFDVSKVSLALQTEHQNRSCHIRNTYYGLQFFIFYFLSPIVFISVGLTFDDVSQLCGKKCKAPEGILCG